MKKIILRHLLSTLALSGVLVLCLAFTHVYAGPQLLSAAQVEGNAQPELVVQIEAGGDPRTFDFTLNPADEEGITTFSASENDPAARTLKPGTRYTLSAAEPPAGWRLAGVSCAPDKFTVAGNTVSGIKLSGGSGSTAICTFTYEPVVDAAEDDPVEEPGTIVIVKNTSGGNGTFAFSGTGDLGTFNLITTEGEASQTFPNLAPGSYTVTEADPALPFDFTSLECDDPTNNTTTSDRTATIDLDPGETVTCTFTNTKRGTIIVKKVMVGGTGSFTFAGTPSGSITTNNGTIQASVAPGQHQSTETVPAGWDLTSIECDDVNSTGNVDTRTATFNVEAGETVTCTFTNVKRATVIVKKVMVGGTGSFTFADTPSGTISSNNGELQASVAPGQYQVTETVPTGWDLTDISCNHANSTGDVGTRTATFNVVAGQEVTCTFTNTRRGTLIVEKSASPADTGQGFTFQRSFGGDFTLSAGGSRTFLLRPGSHTVGEIIPIGWLLSTSCTNGVNTNPATISLASGETVSCTFANSAQATSIQLTKSATPATVEPGGAVEYRYEVRNTSLAPLSLSNINLQDDKCSPITGPSGPLNWNTTRVYTCTANIAVDTANTATITARDFLGRPVSDTDTAFVDVRPTVTISKTVTLASRPEPAGLFNFALTITNTSPERVRITELSDSYPLSAECLALKDKVLEAGAAVSCHYSVTHTQPGTYENTATVTVREVDRGHPLDMTDLEATASATVYLFVGAPLAVTKTPRANVITEPGGPVVFDVTVRNHHPAIAVTLTGFDDSVFGDITVIAQNGVDATDCALVTVAAGGVYSCSFSAVISGEAGGRHTNTLTVSGRAGDANLYTAQASAQVTIGAAPAPLTVTKRDFLVTDHNLNGQVNPLDEIEYQITVTNSGKQAATGITLEDTPDSNTALVVGSVLATGGAQVVTGNSPGDTRVKVTLPDPLAVGASFVVTFRVQVKEPLPPEVDTVSNQALVTGDNILPTLSDDPDTPAPGDPTVTPVTGLPDVLLSKNDVLLVDADGDGFPSPGDTLSYELVLTNRGGQIATGIELTDSVDENTSLVAGSVQTSQGQVNQGNAPGDTAVRIAVGNLDPNTTVTISFQVVIVDPLPAGVGTVSNQARVTGSNFAPVLSDDPATDAINDPTLTAVTAAPLLVVSKRDFLYADADGDDQAGPGDTIFYLIQVHNIGNTTAANVLLSDTPDAQTTLIAGNVQTSQGEVLVGNNAGDRLVQVELGDIPPGATANIGFRVRINASATEPLVNQATVQFINPNDAAQTVITVLSDDPDTPPIGDPTVTPIKPAQPGGGLLDLLLPFVFR